MCFVLLCVGEMATDWSPHLPPNCTATPLIAHQKILIPPHLRSSSTLFLSDNVSLDVFPENGSWWRCNVGRDKSTQASWGRRRRWGRRTEINGGQYSMSHFCKFHIFVIFRPPRTIGDRGLSGELDVHVPLCISFLPPRNWGAIFAFQEAQPHSHQSNVYVPRSPWCIRFRVVYWADGVVHLSAVWDWVRREIGTSFFLLGFVKFVVAWEWRLT